MSFFRKPFAAALVFTLAGGHALAQDAPSRDTARGEALYLSTGCWECHGFVAQGGAAGPALAPPIAYEPFLLQLRQPRFVMIPYSEAVLSDQQAADIYAYIAAMPPAPDPATIPLLQNIP